MIMQYLSDRLQSLAAEVNPIFMHLPART